MDIKSLVVGVVLAIVLAAGGFFFGYRNGHGTCVQCEQVNAVWSLRSLFETTQKVILAEEMRSIRAEFELKSLSMPRVARFLSSLGLKESAKATMTFDSRVAYGYDLSDASKWALKQESPGKFVFEAPPLGVVTCPSALTQTIRLEVLQRSLFVDEDARVIYLTRLATAYALSEAHKRLHDEAARKGMLTAVDDQLKVMIVRLATGLGMKLVPDDIRIAHPRGDFVAPEDWVPAGANDKSLDPRTEKALADAKCTGFVSA
jgi:hypothetical protein